MQIDDRWELLRHVRLTWHPQYELMLWDCNEVRPEPQTLCAYRFLRDGKVIFEAADYGCSPLIAVDSDEALIGLMGFLTLRPGDTDSEYFASYTQDQFDWATAEAEELSLYGMDEESYGMDEESLPRFINVDDETPGGSDD